MLIELFPVPLHLLVHVSAVLQEVDQRVHFPRGSLRLGPLRHHLPPVLAPKTLLAVARVLLGTHEDDILGVLGHPEVSLPLVHVLPEVGQVRPQGRQSSAWSERWDASQSPQASDRCPQHG